MWGRTSGAPKGPQAAEEEGFEPPIPVKGCRFSRPVQSTALPLLWVSVWKEAKLLFCFGFWSMLAALAVELLNRPGIKDKTPLPGSCLSCHFVNDPGCKAPVLADHLNTHRIHSLLAALLLVLHLIVFTNVVDQTRRVNKNVCASVVWLNEAKPFGLIEKLHRSLHFD